MASERQIAANRRNAQKSTGPKSPAGKKRASRNAYRHGLAAYEAVTGDRAKRVEALSRTIAGAEADVDMLELARSAARAECDLAQIRCLKNALLDPISAESPCSLPSGEIKDRVATRRSRTASSPSLPSPPPRAKHSFATLNAVAARRGALGLLKTLDRYERRASGRRESAVRQITARKIYQHYQQLHSARTKPIAERPAIHELAFIF
jgi:hypothetical protein